MMEIIDGKPVNVEVAKRDFKYYIFDWDDNILHMPTRIYLEKLSRDGVWRPVSVSTSTFALVRTDTEHYRMPRNGGRVAIVTARGHAPSTIREAVNIFIDSALSHDERAEMMSNLRGYRYCFDKVEKFGTDEEELDYFLSMCRYHAVTNPDFKERLAGDDDFGARVAEATSEQRPELAKEFAIRDFVEHLFRTLQRTNALGHQVAVGFSDDDAGNVAAVSDYIRSELARRFGGFKFVVYDTSDPSLSNGRKVTVAGQLTLPGF